MSTRQKLDAKISKLSLRKKAALTIFLILATHGIIFGFSYAIATFFPIKILTYTISFTVKFFAISIFMELQLARSLLQEKSTHRTRKWSQFGSYNP